MQAPDYSTIALPPPDAVFGVSDRFKKDPSPQKVNLVIGAYRDEEGKPWVLPCVQEAKERLPKGHEYLPMGGDPDFLKAAQRILFGDAWIAENSARVASVQSLSGTGALRLGTEFFKRFLPGRTVYLPNPTWANHKNICADSGVESGVYNYYSEQTKGLDFEGMIKSLESFPDGSIILLHGVAHNPTGVDPKLEQWEAIAKVMTGKNHIAFFDCAYQGFASGDLDKDAAAIRMWANAGAEFFVSQSFAKNFGLYGERTGCIHVVLKDAKPAIAISAQLQRIVRAMYSNPPSYGANLIKTIIGDAQLYEQWRKDLVTMASRLLGVRQALHAKLVELGTPGDWRHIIDQIGMFTYTGLTATQVERLITDFHIYLLSSGRISLAGLNGGNIEYVAKAIHAVVTEAPATASL